MNGFLDLQKSLFRSVFYGTHLLILSVLFLLGLAGCDAWYFEPTPMVGPISSVTYQREIYFADYFDSFTLWSPGVTDVGQVCSKDNVDPITGHTGFCYPVDSEYYVMVVHENNSPGSLNCPGFVDRIVTLWSIPAGALDDGLLELNDYNREPEFGSVAFGGATAATARLSPETAAKHPIYELGPNQGRGNGFRPGVFLVKASGNDAYGKKIDSILADSFISLTVELMENNGVNNSDVYHFLPLEPTCSEQMGLAQGMKMTGVLTSTTEIVSSKPNNQSSTSPAPSSGYATLSGNAFMFHPSAMDWELENCGNTEVFAVDMSTGNYYSTLLTEIGQCQFSIEVPAPGTYTLSAINNTNQWCGTYLSPDNYDKLVTTGCNLICEPDPVNVMPGDHLVDRNIPIYLSPDNWPKGQPCAFIPIEAQSPLQIQIELVNLSCDPMNYFVDGVQMATARAGETIYFNTSPGTHSTQICVDGTSNCGSAFNVTWSMSMRQEIPRGIDCGDFNSPVRLNVESVSGCTATVNGFIKDIKGPWNWDWGDFTYSTGWFPQTHKYASNGSYSVMVSTPGGTYWNSTTVNVSGCK